MKKIKLAVGYGHSGSLIFAGPGSHRAMELEWAVLVPIYPCAYQKKHHLPKEKKKIYLFFEKLAVGLCGSWFHVFWITSAVLGRLPVA